MWEALWEIDLFFSISFISIILVIKPKITYF